MRAAFLQHGKIGVGDVPEPTPQTGQALVRVLSCGLCAADAHFLQMGTNLVTTTQRFEKLFNGLSLERRLVMGHEFVGEIVDYGPDSRRPLAVGTRVTSQPIVQYSGGRATIGQDHDYPGGFGEFIVLDERLMLAVPDSLDPHLAAMVEPLAVGLEHARSGEPTPEDRILVVGCGAIGLGVVAGLKLKGLGPVVATDLDPARRDLALRMGADAVVDPRAESPYEARAESGVPTLIYECTGSPGILSQIMKSAGWQARIVVGGFSLEPEQILIPDGQSKRLKLLFAAGEERQDMELALSSIADGTIDVGAWVGTRIGLDGVGPALEGMRHPSAPVRTVLDPWQS